MPEIIIPHNYTPREYQEPLFKAFDNGIKRGVVVWHRRSGKDKTLLNFAIKKMFERVGAYYYFFPTYAQGKKILWDGVDRDGFKFLSHFPSEIITSKNDSEMKIKVKNDSLFQVIGTDNINSIVGTNPIGCVFSEYSLQNPAAWEFVRPILRENGGWVIFNYTPRGRNHGKILYDMAKKNKDWFCQLLTVDDTRRPDGTPVISPGDIQAERNEGMDEDLIQQEFFCSFDAAIQGAYYSRQLKEAQEQGRIGSIPWESELPVDTWWDLGIGDSTAIWFSQSIGEEIRLIDYYEASGLGLTDYIAFLKTKPYTYGEHFAPHDISIREFSTGKARIDFAREKGIDFRVVQKLDIDDGIDAARRIFHKCWFDEVKCEQGLNALTNYHKEYDDKRKEYKNKPYHDWSSHAADAFRYFAVGHEDYKDYKIDLGDDRESCLME